MVDITFICLSKSLKNSEYCIAGKVRDEDGTIGQWIRPLNKFGSINDRDCLYSDKTHATTLDIITATFIDHKPEKFQVENCIIDSDKYWNKIGVYDFSNYALDKLCDKPDTLWFNNHQSGGGKNDQVSPEEAKKIQQSLYFIYVNKVTIFVSRWEGKLKVRGEFVYNHNRYNLKVTDLHWIGYYKDKETGIYHLDNMHITLSLALETFQGFHYKLIADLI